MEVCFGKGEKDPVDSMDKLQAQMLGTVISQAFVLPPWTNRGQQAAHRFAHNSISWQLPTLPTRTTTAIQTGI